MPGTRESIFFSCVRAFFVTVCSLLGVGAAIFFIMIIIGQFPEQVQKPEKSELVLHADADGNRKLLDVSAPVFLSIKMHGVVGEGDFTTEAITNLLLDAEEEEQLNGRVKGLLLDLNTPGGLSTDSHGIFHALKVFKAKHKLPIYAFVDGICASGGMIIASVADQIFATPSSLVGSVGALMGPMFNVSGAMEKIGVTSRIFTDGKDKDLLNPFRPWKEGEGDSLQPLVEAEYKRFVDLMVAQRPRLDKEKLINVYGANIFDAAQGQEYGYIDVAGTFYNDALAALVKAAEIAPEKKYQVFEIKAHKSFLQQLLQSKSTLLKGKIVHTFETGSPIKPEMSGKLLLLYTGSAS